MSGTPTEAELQTQWRAATDILETARLQADGTMADGGGKFDVLIQALEGDYTPDLSAVVSRYRATYASMIDPASVLEMIGPFVFEYARLLAADGTVGFGSGYQSIGELFNALKEWFVSKSLTVASREITFDTSATKTGTGDGDMARLTVDKDAFALEACHVERKIFRCREDKNSGTQAEAELFEFVGATSSFDSVLRGSFGSGDGAREFLNSHNAGSGAGGSLLQNSSFSDFDSSATPRYVGWTTTFGGAAVAGDITQDTTNFYRSHPGAQTDAAMKLAMNSASDKITFKQTIDDMRVQRLNPETPYFLRVMLNKTVGTAVGGTVYLRLGSQTVSISIASLAANWAELIVPLDKNLFLKNFNEDPFDIEIEWDAGTSGTLLLDDMLFAPFDLVDGTWWFLRMNDATPVAWLVDDTLTFTDTGGAAGTGKVQWWLWVAGLGFLPHTAGAETFADPS